ncbi:MAG: alpha-amylase, partial [Xanthobacteraceae bacterium]
APALFGDVVRIAPDGTTSTLAVALGFVRHQGDAWSWTLDQLKHALDGIAAPEAAADTELADLETVMAAIGQRLGEMHAVLARETSDEAFAPQTASAVTGTQWAQKVEERLNKAFVAIAHREKWEREQDSERAHSLLELREAVMSVVRRLAQNSDGALMIRNHGDFHLGQVLVASGEAYIIDFEGEPMASIAERRAKTSPLRDVAGLLRSIDYAGATLIDRDNIGVAPVDEARRDEFIVLFRQRAAIAFLRSYWRAGALKDTPATRALLDLFLIEKAAYEIAYEAANRPSWIGVPLAGLQRLLTRILHKEAPTGHG